MFRSALTELGVPFRAKDIQVKHLDGITTFKGREFGLVFPNAAVRDSFGPLFETREISYNFSGFFEPNGGRAEALYPFSALSGAKIVNSKWGRVPLLKKFNGRGYIADMRNSQFALCPMHSTWPGPAKSAWTYRFAEAVLNGAIPVTFRDLPLGRNFTKGFKFFDSEELLSGGVPADLAAEIQAFNFAVGKERFNLNKQAFEREISG